MHYSIAFSGIAEPELRRLLMGDGANGAEPITAVSFISKWTWQAVIKIAKRDKMRVSRVLARAVRHYVIAEGFNAPTFDAKRIDPKAAATEAQSRPGLVSRIARHFKIGE